VTVRALNRTLDQELAALARGASMECLVCGEFLWRTEHALACLECRSILADGADVPELALPSVAQAG
jgi:hypothetical protein